MPEAAIPARLGAREAMPLDDILKQVEGFDLENLLSGVPGVSAMSKEMAKNTEQVNALAAKLAEPEFLPLLEWLLDITLRRPTHPGFFRTRDENYDYALRREGANSVVWKLLQAIAEGRGEIPPAREGT